jgi:hypothetical protein
VLAAPPPPLPSITGSPAIPARVDLPSGAKPTGRVPMLLDFAIVLLALLMGIFAANRFYYHWF